jgi:DNA-binding NtrC family response regulator
MAIDGGMELTSISRQPGTVPPVLWVGRAAEPSISPAPNFLDQPGAECLVAVLPGALEVCLEWLESVRRQQPDLPVILLLEEFSFSVARQLRLAGAFEVLAADAPQEEVQFLIQEAREQYSRRRSLRSVPAWRKTLVGNCQAIERLAEAIRLIAERRSTILITGETGTGKEVVAKAIHAASGRTGPLVSLNCAALPETLLEAELFGHTRGAFTGAQQARAGRFEAAHRGSIFLDEIGDMPLELQAKLLRVLQEREVQRLGSSENIPVDVRVIAATNADLLSKVEDGRFREDLYYRLNVVPLHLPPLREREGDVALLAQHFVEKICGQEGIAVKRLTPAAVRRLEEYSWPGNIRELENTVERAIALSGRRTELWPADFLLPAVMKKPTGITADCLQLTLPEEGIDLERIIAGLERQMIEQALRRTKGNKSAAAELLQLKRTTLGAKMRTLGAGEGPRALTA